jgi:glutamate-5-semialdehyde dehydrogenase
MSSASVRAIAESARRASRSLASLDEANRNRVLEAIASALEHSANELFAANQLDLQSATARKPEEALPESTLARLKLDET